jgi:cardiolipin synthase
LLVEAAMIALADHGAAPARLLENARTTWATMLAHIAGAKRTIHLEVYAFFADEVGERFIEALSAAAARGVAVEVVVDGWGSMTAGNQIVERLSAAGCRARVHNRLRWGFLGRLHRNHRKLLLVDGSVAVLGGINIGDQFTDWEDVALELRGPACHALARRIAGEHFVEQRGPIRVHLSRMGGGARLRRMYVKAFASARRRIRLAHGYFLPDAGMVRRLVAASRRGVSVALLLAGHSDVPLGHLATASLDGRLGRAGIRIAEWNDSVLHAKLAVVDSRRVLLGSFNLDPFSLVCLEALVIVDDARLAAEAERWIERRLAQGTVPPVSSAWWQVLSLFGRFVVVLVRMIAWLLKR